MVKYLSVLIMSTLMFCGCKPVKSGEAKTAPASEKPNAESNKPEAPPIGSVSPMSCIVKGQVLGILPPEAGADSICIKYHCRARVKILDIVACGSSVSLFFNSGDTLDMAFAFSLSDTKIAFPRMNARYRGLKTGDKFTANAHQRLKPGSGEYFMVYGYEKE